MILRYDELNFGINWVFGDGIDSQKLQCTLTAMIEIWKIDGVRYWRYYVFEILVDSWLIVLSTEWKTLYCLVQLYAVVMFFILVLQLHRLPNEPITDDNEKFTCLEHSTSVSFTVACNCGKMVRNIGDPFTAKVS